MISTCVKTIDAGDAELGARAARNAKATKMRDTVQRSADGDQPAPSQ